jgi:hemolysin activation/secretion protein
VRGYTFEGNTAFTDAELAAVAAPFTGREIASGDLEELRLALTRLYVDAGYVSSGAVIPDQRPVDGVIRIQLVEGGLGAIEIEGNRHFQAGYLRRRIALAGGSPLDVGALERRLQLLQQDPRIRRLEAELGPGPRRGEATLRLRVEETRPYFLWVEGSNYESPTVGAARARIGVGHDNLFGVGDRVAATFSVTEGYREIDTLYEIPVTPWDTTVGFWYQHGNSEVVEDPVEDLDVDGKSTSYGVGIHHPLLRTLDTTLTVGVDGELRRSETSLFGERFSFAPGVQDGVSQVTVLRFFQELIYRSQVQVVAARSQVSWGLDALGATVNPGDLPDGQFVSWLGQFQWARRLPWLGLEPFFRCDVQLANHPLLPLEQFAVGGPLSVRGYRTNQFVRDMGADASLELRVPVLRDRIGAPVVQLVPFVDWGRSWFRERESVPPPETLWGVGLGVRWSIAHRAELEVFWGHPLREVPEPSDHDLQDEGVYALLSVDLL